MHDSIKSVSFEEKMVADTRKIEIFSAGCPTCTDAVELIRGMACPSCEITVLDMKDSDVAARAATLGIRSVPAVLVDGALADCCAGRGVDAATLKAAGIGMPLA